MLIFNLLGYNFTWFGLIYWGNAFIPVAITFLVAHFYWNRNRVLREFIIIFSVAYIGIVVDSILQFTGVFIFPESNHLPLWLMALWVCFATTITQSLSLLSYSKLYQGLVGFFLAPLSYLAGQQLNVVEFGMTTIETYLLLSFIWCFLMLSFFYIKGFLSGEVFSHA